MRIVVISNMYPSDSDPVYGTFIETSCEGLKNQSIEIVSLIVIRGRAQSMFRKIGRYFRFYWSALSVTFSGKYDLVLSHNLTHSSFAAWMVSHAGRRPLAINIHGTDLLGLGLWRTALRWLALKLIGKCAALVIVPSEFLAKELLARYPTLCDRVFVSASGGIPCEFYQHLSSRPEARRASRTLVIGYISRIDPGKGWRYFLRAIQQLSQQVEAQTMAVVMVGDGGETRDLEREIKRLELSGQVEYRGAVSRMQLPAICAELDCMVFPTELPEALGLSGIEAMAAGLPVIGSRIGALKDIIIDGYNGYGFTPGNVDELQQCLLKFRAMPQSDRLHMSKNARATAAKYREPIVSAELATRLKLLCPSAHE